ncbi:hypothetical protein KRX52_14915 [Pseudomonas sp. MAP12]|uniref:Uncharacterized protein n=1 Tax=Geopseudomonas aromaticivorans TaxID=2849492 RepID=A0ABS6MZ48_9GAMM|nr:hypothetical protein [Pseudomonas aromaticivorans]MBV2134069.1 hypothetical protein [Pseudomonas aromaticivorans]
MAALDYLRRAGLTVEAVADKLRVSPRERITPEARQYITDHKAALLAELTAAMPPQPRAWLHLLALADGRVTQRTGDLDTTSVEGEVRLQFGEELLAVVPVPGFERLLSLEEIAKALAGTLAAPAALPPPSNTWLTRVARLLGTRPAELLDGEYLEQHDLVELAGSDAALVVETIRSSPAWINRRAHSAPSTAVIPVEEDTEPQRTVHTAATASVDWLTARDQFYQHLMTCRDCHAPAGRYCPSGSDLRLHYNNTSQETNE